MSSVSSVVRILPSGPQALLAEYQSLRDVMSVADRLHRWPLAGVVDTVPAARTILVTFTADADRDALTAALENTTRSIDPVESRLVLIDVHYDGEDLPAVADACGLTVDQVIERHSVVQYTVAFCGFMPGFSYLVGLDPRLHLPRRATPRTRVPAGSIAIAGEYTAVYPTASPGGWHLLGRTDAVMWDDARTAPALLPPGTRVKFAAR